MAADTAMDRPPASTLEGSETEASDTAVSEATGTIRLVAPATRAADTPLEASEELTRIWRSRSHQERWALLAAMDADVEALARAGIVWAHPDFTEAQVDRELIRRRFGDQLTLDVWPEQLP